MNRSSGTAISLEAGVAIWIAIVSASSVLFSLGLACATPFAALATVSALGLRRWPALGLVTAAWAVNQAVGFGLLHYPPTPDTIAWGLAIGLAALGATAAVQALRTRMASPLPATVIGFALAFAIYEGVVFAATTILPSSDGAFSLAVVGRILLVNLLALAGLVLLHRAALAVRLLGQSEPASLARA